jgi:hypothetical protein
MSSLSETFSSATLTSGAPDGFADLNAVQDRIELFLRNTMPMLTASVAVKQAEAGRIANEPTLAAVLCRELHQAASDQVFWFMPEDPNDPTAQRTLDYASYPTAALKVGSQILGIHDRLYAIEAKRLPAPPSSIEDREREYVISAWKSREAVRKGKTGGIERFKEGIYVSNLSRSGMIAFVQRQDFAHWHTTINGWIDDLIAIKPASHDAAWSAQDKLTELANDSPSTASCNSSHNRPDGTTICLFHCWLSVPFSRI